MLSYINTGQYKAMFIRYNQFNNYWHNTHSNNRNNHISDQFENGEMVILIQQIDDNSEKQTFVLNINAANQTFNRDGQDLSLFFGEDPFLHEWLYHYANKSLISPNEPIKRATIKNLNMLNLLAFLEE